MASVYDEVEIEDMEFDDDLKTYFFPCPCGDRFQITLVGCSVCTIDFMWHCTRRNYTTERISQHVPVVPSYCEWSSMKTTFLHLKMEMRVAQALCWLQHSGESTVVSIFVRFLSRFFYSIQIDFSTDYLICVSALMLWSSRSYVACLDLRCLFLIIWLLCNLLCSLCIHYH